MRGTTPNGAHSGAKRGFGWLTEPVIGFRMVKGEGFSAQFRFNSLAQGAHLTGSIKLLTRPIRSASALSWRFQFGGFALRFSAFFLSSLAIVSSFSFPSFPSVLCSCLLLLFLFVSLVCLSVGVSVCWCVASLGWVPFRSVPFRCFAFCPPPRSDVSNKSGVTKWVLSLANWASRLPEVI